MVMAGEINKRWEKGKYASLFFYRHKLQWKEEQFNHKFPLAMYFKPMIGDKKNVSILDVGAGMFNTVGCLWHNVDIQVTCCDILADEYKKILDEYKIEPIHLIEKQDMEDLTYEDKSFDIVHCVNALDHCIKPEKAIREMYRVCRKGGWIYLRHGLNMGKERHYTGLHQWDIQPVEDGSCEFIGNDTVFLLNDIIPGFKTELKQEVGNEPPMVVSILNKV